MSYQNIFKRYEIKYFITKEQKQQLCSAMEEYMEPDRFARSTIRNIYFDTPDKLLIRRSLEKPVYKEKLRVRSYGPATSGSQVFIELKKKFDGVVYKRRVSMSEEEAMNYLCKNRLPEKTTQITKEINYFTAFYKDINPAVFLSYEREAFYSKTDADFRMTFDENILWRDYDMALTQGIYGDALLDKNLSLLEVKTALGIPLWLTRFFSENHIYRTSFSKYGSAYRTMLQSKMLGGSYVA